MIIPDKIIVSFTQLINLEGLNEVYDDMKKL